MTGPAGTTFFRDHVPVLSAIIPTSVTAPVLLAGPLETSHTTMRILYIDLPPEPPSKLDHAYTLHLNIK